MRRPTRQGAIRLACSISGQITNFGFTWLYKALGPPGRALSGLHLVWGAPVPLTCKISVARRRTMKIIQTRQAPNPRRVRVFLAEKGIEVAV